MHVAGLGCRRGCTLESLLVLLHAALDEAGLRPGDLAGLASSMHKRDEPGLLCLADHLRLPLAFLSAERLSAYHDRLTRKSPLALSITGSSGVAEASALAQAETLGAGPARLLLPKRSSAVASLALATAPPHTLLEHP
ncbi:cobalamin biosynthesis protein [Azotobacter armeniacus]